MFVRGAELSIAVPQAECSVEVEETAGVGAAAGALVARIPLAGGGVHGGEAVAGVVERATRGYVPLVAPIWGAEWERQGE